MQYSRRFKQRNVLIYTLPLAICFCGLFKRDMGRCESDGETQRTRTRAARTHKVHKKTKVKYLRSERLRH